MASNEELMDLIDKANNLIVTQDRIIENQTRRIEAYECLCSKQEDVIKLLKFRIKELEG